MVHNIFVLYRRPSLSREEFRRHWIEVRPPLVLKISRLVDFVQSFLLGGGGDPKSDGVGWISFESQAAMEADLASPKVWEALAFLPEFLGLEKTYSIIAEMHEQV